MRPATPRPRPPAARPPEPGAEPEREGGLLAPTHLVVGRVLAPWGRRGEFRVEIMTDFPERFSQLHEIQVGDSKTSYRVQSARLYQSNVLLKLEGIDAPEQAAELRGELLYVPLSEAMPLGEDQYYHYQILGLDVWTTGGKYLGKVIDILETGSNDVYVAKDSGREVLIPALADVVQQVDLEHHRLLVTLPPGLVEEEEA